MTDRDLCPYSGGHCHNWLPTIGCTAYQCECRDDYIAEEQMAREDDRKLWEEIDQWR